MVTMCPFCWVNLSKAAGDRLVVNDIANVLAACGQQDHRVTLKAHVAEDDLVHAHEGT